MKGPGFLTVWCCGMFILTSGYAGLMPAQTSDSTKNNASDPAGTRWDGSIDWTEKSRIQGRMVDVPYRDVVSFRFSADGTCISRKTQPCKWERKGQTITIAVEQTKKACPGSATLTLEGDVMSGTWEPYGGFTCFHISPTRSIKLKRHK
jgi:hypothetical protein